MKWSRKRCLSSLTNPLNTAMYENGEGQGEEVDFLNLPDLEIGNAKGDAQTFNMEVE